ncbi:MAG: hypothetical protein QM770_11790 [Tepidisphaeraceae bacterium]
MTDAPKKKRPFTLRPFWRDHLVAYVLLGLGFLINDIAATPSTLNRAVVRVLAIVAGGTGLVVLACAVGSEFVSDKRD